MSYYLLNSYCRFYWRTCRHGPSSHPCRKVRCGYGPWYCPLLLLPAVFVLVGGHIPLHSDSVGPLQRYLCHHTSRGAIRGLTQLLHITKASHYSELVGKNESKNNLRLFWGFFLFFTKAVQQHRPNKFK